MGIPRNKFRFVFHDGKLKINPASGSRKNKSKISCQLLTRLKQMRMKDNCPFQEYGRVQETTVLYIKFHPLNEERREQVLDAIFNSPRKKCHFPVDSSPAPLVNVSCSAISNISLFSKSVPTSYNDFDSEYEGVDLLTPINKEDPSKSEAKLTNDDSFIDKWCNEWCNEWCDEEFDNSSEYLRFLAL